MKMTKTKKLLYNRIKRYLLIEESISPYNIDGPLRQANLIYGPNVVEPGHFTKTGTNNLLRQLRFERVISDKESRDTLKLLYSKDNEVVLMTKEFINIRVKEKYTLSDDKVIKQK